ncbi:t-SNARE affecting a late Golgi compartment protein 2, variant 2 [Pleurotus ostreatus]|nr:t-SNARE affecting a late Golgi compartment protein 2, variant 2 [Pleurotus ostreatus]
MATRSRTLLFLSYRDSTARSSRRSRSRIDSYPDPYAQDDDEREGLISSSGQPVHAAIEVDALPPKWVDVADQVEDILAGTQAKITALEKLHAKHVLPGFTDRSLEEQEIESAATEITRDFRKCQALIQRIGTLAASTPHPFPPSPYNAQTNHHEALTAKNVQRGLAAKVQELSAAFRKKQRVYMEKLQGHAIKNQDLLLASGTISLKGSEGMSAVDEDVEAAHSTQSQTQTQFTGNTDLQARDRELQEIAKSISSLAELFRDLSALVIDQGTLLDSVEYNIEQTAVNMQDAVRELNVATRYFEAAYLCGPALEIDHRFILQLSEKHWKAEMHFLAVADHSGAHFGAHLQTKTPLGSTTGFPNTFTTPTTRFPPFTGEFNTIITDDPLVYV